LGRCGVLTAMRGHGDYPNPEAETLIE
jgi:hypothetical protein